MQPSSLIFLVIIAVWAAYFVQYWVRRREHLATAQSVDRFSETMRVLERRSPLPATDLSTAARPSYAVSPARAVRAQVLVKRAETATFTMTPAGAVTPGAGSVAGSDHSDHSDHAGGWGSTFEPEDDGHSWDVESAPRDRPARAVRGLTLVAALAAFVVAVPLAVFGVLPWAGVLAPLAVAAGAFVWLRQAVAAEQTARRGASRPAPRAADQREHSAPSAQQTLASTSEEGEPVTVRARGELYDLQEVEQGLAAPVRVTPAAAGLAEIAAAEIAAAAASATPARSVTRPIVDEDDIPLTWDPVPVPRPTYTMKSRATRPAPASADLVGDADTEYARYEQEPVRRVAGA
ncbi:MAG: hypothetical protein ABIQ13_01700 [Pedococcus sp.]